MKVKVLNRLSYDNDNDKSSDLAENKNYMCDNQVYDLTTEIEAIKMFIKEQFCY